MVKENVVISIGQCGTFVGKEFWECLCKEHNVNQSGSCQNNTNPYITNYFTEKKGTFKPRSIFADSEPSAINAVMQSSFGKALGSSNYIGKITTKGTWSQGYITAGKQGYSQIITQISTEVEKCDHFQGFQIISSLGGGTGSGLTSFLLDKLQDIFPKSHNVLIPILPSIVKTEMPIEIYNIVLAMKHCKNSSLFLIENDALQKHGTDFAGMNKISGYTFADLTAGSRFISQNNKSLKSLSSQLTCTSNTNVFSISEAPICLPPEPIQGKNKPSTLLNLAFDGEHHLFNYSPERILAMGALFRGKNSYLEIEEDLKSFQATEPTIKNIWKTVENNAKTIISLPAFAGSVSDRSSIAKTSVTIASNAIGTYTNLFQNVLKKYDTLLQGKKFIQYYIDDGMEQSLFDEAKTSMKELIDAATELNNKF